MSGARRGSGGVVQVLVAVGLVLAVAWWGAGWFAGRAGEFGVELQRRQAP